MKITNDGAVMTCAAGHSARAVDDQRPYGEWRVSWLPDRTVTRNQAVTALVLAACVTDGATGPAHQHWPHVQGWAAELGLTAPDAVTAIHLASTY
ncbi:hypothetical protein [Actinophytocola algeriensis]|uniref:Uncharacterized protein n=1 Tax=Actinophytocola algeriensis TaxID=1768010 RepID=A0A7W7Q3S3_9PSEU|nr:hypothetical protein [Actinophytocola algeriensis]MBB4906367.1 hypothetical protein [Actinophytocola algeriensis]MBE1477848.1 hypothetical protein [Actinophytocola algeriensis]